MSERNGQAGEVAIVTGAASGMGLASAQAMAADGWNLLLCDVDEARLREAGGAIGGQAGVDLLAGDIADAAFATRLEQALGERPVGALVHCAGLSPAMADPARILEVNLAATMRLLDVVRPRMATGGAAVLFASIGGHVVGTALDARLGAATTPAAVAGLVAFTPDSASAYAVSKRAVQLLAVREAHAFGARGARIVSLSPGIVDTPMGQAEFAREPAMHGIVANAALPRTGTAAEIAAVAAFLWSPAASFITGADILVDGGSMAGAARQAS